MTGDTVARRLAAPPAPSRCVSIIVPVHNAARWVGAAVRSALDQDETLEVLLIEDGSSDDSLTICRELATLDARVRLMRHADGGNHGPAASRNVGIRNARGPYVAFLDADDWYLPRRFQVSVPMLEEALDVDGVYEAVRVVFEDDAARAEWSLEPHRGTLVTVPPATSADEVLPSLLDGRGVFCTDGIVVRRAVFDAVGPFDEDLEIGSDTAMWWKMAASHRLVAGTVDAPVAVYRRHLGSRASVVDARYRYAAVRVATTVWKWSRERPLPDATREHIAMALMHRIISGPPGVAGWKALFARAWRILVTVVRVPEILCVPALWVRVMRQRLYGLRGRSRAAW